MYSSELEVILKRYESAIAALESAKKQFTSTQIVEVLKARDALQDFLTKNSEKFNADFSDIIETVEDKPTEFLAETNCFIQLSKIPELDERLQAQGPAIAEEVNLPQWRESFQPSAQAWWWFFEPKKKVHKWDQYDWVWSGLSVVFITGAMTFLAETVSPFLRVEPDIFGSFTVISQSILTYFTAKGALTKKGQEAIEYFLESINLPKYFWQEVKLGMSILLFFSFWGFYHQLPRVGQHYFNKGKRDYAEYKLISAEKNYKRALEFAPDNSQIYYRLALVYENMQEDNEARTNYLIAADGGSVYAYNNLSRLYILEGQYVQAAIAANEGQKIIHQRHQGDYLLPDNLEIKDNEEERVLREHQIKDSEIRAYLRKNLGWARLKQGRLAAAKAELEQAIRLKPNLGSAYCLLAEVLEQQKQVQKALAQWENCLAYAQAGNTDEETWIQMSQERLSSAFEPAQGSRGAGEQAPRGEGEEGAR